MRKRPLRPSLKPLKRRARLRPRNHARRARLRAEQFGPEGEWMRDRYCAVCASSPPSEPAHVKGRGAGGKRDQMVPLCAKCHRELHQVGQDTFDARTKAVVADGPTLAQLAKRYAQDWKNAEPEVRFRYEKLFQERYPRAARYLEANRC